MLRNAEDKEQSTETSTSNDPVVDQQMLELLQLLEKDIDLWLKQNVDLKSRTNPTVSKFQLCETHGINCAYV